MNKVILIGRLTADPELRQTTNGNSVCKFTVACNNGKDADGKERPADFITCQAWDKTADFVSKWFSKGKSIVVEGSMKTDKYQDKNHQDVTHYNSYVLVRGVEFAGDSSGSNNTQPTQTAPTPTPQAAPAAPVVDDGDVPF